MAEQALSQGKEKADATGEDPCVIVQVSLLPKVSAPKAFKALPPITILQTSTQSFSKVLQIKAVPCESVCSGGAEASDAMMGFRRSFQCAERTMTMRRSVERSLEWGVAVVASQIDFARAYGSIHYGVFCEYAETSGFGAPRRCILESIAPRRSHARAWNSAQGAHRPQAGPPPGMRPVTDIVQVRAAWLLGKDAMGVNAMVHGLKATPLRSVGRTPTQG